MSVKRIAQRNRGSRLHQATVAIFAVALVIVTQGCCSPPVTHSLAFGIDTDRCPCDDATCVCPVPESFRVHRGDKVQFVNASPYEVKIVPSNPATFDEGSPIVIPGKKTVQVNVSSAAPSPGVSLDMFVTLPGTLCPGMPGPRMDIDD